MTRMFLVAALFFAYGGSSAFAQSSPENPTPTGTTRVAVLNVGVVFQKYDRATALKKEVENSLGTVKVEAKTPTQNLTAWTASLQKLDLVDPPILRLAKGGHLPRRCRPAEQAVSRQEPSKS